MNKAGRSLAYHVGWNGRISIPSDVVRQIIRFQVSRKVEVDVASKSETVQAALPSHVGGWDQEATAVGFQWCISFDLNNCGRQNTGPNACEIALDHQESATHPGNP